LIVAIAAIVFSGLVGCGPPTKQYVAEHGIVGSWQTANHYTAFTFHANGDGSNVVWSPFWPVVRTSFTWRTKSNGTIVLVYPLGVEYHAHLHGKLLSVEGQHVAALHRVVTIVVPTPTPSPKPEPTSTWGV